MNEEEAIAVINGYKKGKTATEDVAEACYTLKKKYKTCKEAKNKNSVDKSAKFICFWSRIYHLPEDIKWYVSQGIISPKKALYISGINDIEEQRELAWVTIDNKFTTNQIVEAIKDRNDNKKSIQEVLYHKFGIRDEDHLIGILLDHHTYKELRRESAMRKIKAEEICQKIIRQWLNIVKMKNTLDLIEITQQLDQISSRMKEINEL